MWKDAPIADDHAMPLSRKLLPAALLLAVAASLVVTSTASAVAPPPTSARFPKMVYYRQFKQALKPHTWTVYQGVPGCCDQSYWARSHVVSEGGMLRIQTYRDAAYGSRWVSGGVSMARLTNQTYGRWVVRFRMPRGAGVGMDVALRPSGSGTVVDWIEESSDKGAARAIETATLHYGSTRVHAQVKADFTKWHTMILAWTPGHITVRVGHHLWANYTSHVPSSPMHMVMQTNVGTNGFTGTLPNSTTPSRVTLYVDYVAVYRYR